jgi:hypothetical protein
LSSLVLAHLPYPAASQPQLSAAVSAFLQRVPRLEVLRLSDMTLTDSALEHLSSLQSMRSCTISLCTQITTQSLSGLSSRVTSLTFVNATETSNSFKQRIVPAAGWPLLRRLQVQETGVQPALLAHLTALEHLTLNNCGLLPTQQVRNPPAGVWMQQMLIMHTGQA